LEAVRADGAVRVRARNEDGVTIVEIVDDGQGIPNEIRDAIWRPLFTTKRKGTGLGLPSVANIVQRHGGTIWFESVPGRGVTFRLSLPSAESSPGPLPDEGGAAGRRLL